MRYRVAKHGAVLAAVISIIGVCPAQASEQPPGAYVMTVYENVSHGSSILDGPREATIARLARGQDKNLLSDQTNLCVAYAKIKHLEKATEACDFAIVASEKEARRLTHREAFGARTGQIADTGRAIALTNRGVVYALVGETDQARTMFEKALQLDSTEKSAEGNLARLNRQIASPAY